MSLSEGGPRDVSFGDLLRQFRRTAALTQEELAEMAGLSVRTIRSLERGQSRPYRRSVRLLADALNLVGAAREEFMAAPVGRRDQDEDRRSASAAPPSPVLIAATPNRREQPARQAAAGRDGAGCHLPGSGRRSRVGMGSVVEVFAVAIGRYADAGLADLDAEARVGRLADLLAPFGGRYQPWPHPAGERGADAVQQRLRDWSALSSRAGHDSRQARSSVLYWAGHGWSDGTRAALAHATSPAAVGASGLEPQQLAQAIRARQAAAGACGGAGEAAGWALVVIDTSHAVQVADAIMAALHGPDAPGRLLLVAVPDDAVRAGGFPGVLTGLLADTFRAECRITLRDLAGQLERVLGPGSVYQRGLGDAALVRVFPPVASWMSAPVETIGHLEDVLAGLPADERSHFVAKARGAEDGELCWFFEGRQDEIAQIGGWLRRAESGMLVVTGRAGSGKSALLGQVLVLSLPGLRDALARRGLITLPGAGVLPPEEVFDAVVHLSGLTLAQAARRVAAAAGLGRLPSEADPALGVASDLDWLAAQLPEVLAGRERPLTILADALDEATDPLDTGRSLLARLAALPGVRVLAGTRASTNETPDTPANDHNLLSALGTEPGSSRAGRTAVVGTVQVTRDADAIGRYVLSRLRHARDYGVAGHAIPGLTEMQDADLNRAAAAVTVRDREFLYARLAVYELIASPTLLRPGRATSLATLLHGDHQDLFAAALDRLDRLDDHYVPLIQALALARGRGIPEADGTWATVASSLTQPRNPEDHAVPLSQTPQAWAEAIHGLLGQAAAYIAVDTVTGAAERSTIYRLAHRAFIEHFTRTGDSAAQQDRQRRCASALLNQARRVAAADPAEMPSYLAWHLSGHIADTGLWDALAATPRVLDGLDPAAVTADTLRTLFGRSAIPPPIAGVIGARDTLLTATAMDRAGLRQLASTMYSSLPIPDERCHGWGIATARAGQVSMHIRLTGHTATVCSVCAVPLPDGRIVVASASDDGTIRLWDAHTATPIGAPLTGHAGTVEAVCAVPLPGPRMLLASAGSDGTVRVWDPVTGCPVGPPMAGHTEAVTGVCGVPGADGADHRDGRTWIASASSDGTVRVWDPVTGCPVGPPMAGHTGVVFGVCAVPGADGVGRRDGRTWIASAGLHGTVRVWDPVTGCPVGPPMAGHTGAVSGVCAVPGADREGRRDGRTWIASAGADSTVRVWDPVTGCPVGEPLAGHTGPVHMVCAVRGADASDPSGGRTWIASAGGDGTVRVWDPVTGHSVGEPMSASLTSVAALQPLQAPDAACAVVHSAGHVQLWDPDTAALTSVAPTDRHVSALTELGTRAGTGPAWVIADTTGRLAVLTPGQNAPTRATRLGDDTLCLLPVPGEPAQLACASRDGTVTLLDAATLHSTGPPLTGHAGPIRTLCLLTSVRDSVILASAGNDATIRLWDPRRRVALGKPLTGHIGWIWSLTAIPVPGRPASLLASAGADATVRLWDPRTGQAAQPPLHGHTDQVRAVACATASDGSTLLASGSHDGTVRLWHPATGQPIHTIPLGIPIHALLQQQPDHHSRRRTGDGATITVGLRTGVLSLDLDRSMFPTGDHF